MKLAINHNREYVKLVPKMLNRHGVVAGSSGSGKTVTLKYFAEQLSKIGVPCFIGDIKGDLTGFASKGVDSDGFVRRCQSIGAPVPELRDFPLTLHDVFGEHGTPITCSIRNMGDVLLSSIMELNNTQAGVMSVVFRVSEDNDLPLDTIDDLRKALVFCYEHNDEIGLHYGSVSKASIGAIQRNLLTLESSGGNYLFTGEVFDYKELMSHNDDGEGMIHLLNCVRLIQSPKLYACFLVWLLSQFYDNLPERGDADKPLFVFFFDEAHLIFNGASKALVNKVEAIVRLIRSKGVGIYFCSQAPSDIPEEILAQCGNRIQHSLRAATPKAIRAVRTAAVTLRKNPAFNNIDVIQQLSVGEAIISVLDSKGAPQVSERAYILPPSSTMGLARDEDISPLLPTSPLAIELPTMPRIGGDIEFVEETGSEICSESEYAPGGVYGAAYSLSSLGLYVGKGMASFIVMMALIVLAFTFTPFMFLAVPALVGKLFRKQ